ncbi:MAG: cytochrome c oxidase assembly protein [Alphaproteobacteria bacterium]
MADRPQIFGARFRVTTGPGGFRGKPLICKSLVVLAGLVLLLVRVRTAYAHGILQADESPWTAWHLTPDITLGTVLIACLYAAGLWRRRYRTERMRIWRHVSFFAGLAAIFLALQSPIDPIAERVFLVHQVQHLLLRMIGPMLLFLAAPQGLLVAGMPDAAQRRVLTPIVRNAFIRGVFGLFAHPAVATILFISVLYFWQMPKYHNLALLNDYVHYLMHATMLLAGLVFFWRVFDSRSAPLGTRYGVRLMMLWVLILSNILIGSYLALKHNVLYPAYDELGRLWGITALSDEQIGAATIWIPSSMMGLVAVLVVIHMWGRHETMVESRRRSPFERSSGRPDLAMTAAELIGRQAPKNRAMALGFAAFVIAVFSAAILIGVVSQMMGP